VFDVNALLLVSNKKQVSQMAHPERAVFSHKRYAVALEWMVLSTTTKIFNTYKRLLSARERFRNSR
jgi:hypothetical protein